MSKKVKIILSSFLVIIIGIVATIYVEFAGLPWKKQTVGNEILHYLENKYNEEFVIDKRFYNFKDSSYNIKVHPKNNPSVQFNAGEGYGEYHFVDYYAEALWEKQATEDFKSIIEKHFPEKQHFRANAVYGDGMDLVKRPPIPHYSKTKAFIMLGINIPTNFSKSEGDFKKMLAVVKSMQEVGGNIELFISYGPEDDSKNMTYATFTPEEVKKIKSIEDIKRYYNNVQ
ncbi:hypothetical protein ACFYKX_02605 [Cytobacillus sp. FJAT-54145]|uniref:YfjL-like N-terminal domain-containing protein n=1 Tax=Cytobacillus spartinae TaxID=3299023 RepID=A0ABW6K5P9_9BACI